MQLRDYQITISGLACDLLQKYGIAYLALQVRTGKTLTALEAARLYGARQVLFVTKKKAIASIEGDYKALAPGYGIDAINYEQLPNYFGKPDFVIIDEAHACGSFPKPAVRTKELKAICAGKPIIFLSGTPTPESDSQIYHQLWVSDRSPFAEYVNFYKWAKDYVFVETRKFNGWDSNDYSMNSGATIMTLKRRINKDSTMTERALVGAEIAKVGEQIEEKKQKIRAACAHLFLSFSQEEAGFEQMVQEEVIYVKMKEGTYYLAKKLLKDKVAIGNDGTEILGDTPVKLKQKLQQIYSGAVISEPIKTADGKKKPGVPKIFDDTKAIVIRDRFAGQKIGIFYKFAAELAILQSVFGSRLTDSPELFRDSGPELIFCSQIQSGREGINLSTADALIMFNIDFSSVSYQQARARLQSKDRTKPCLLYWVFAENGIEEKIHAAVLDKRDYTLRYFKKDYNIKNDVRAISK